MLLSELLKVVYDGSALLFHQLSYAIEEHKRPPTKKLQLLRRARADAPTIFRVSA